MSDNNSIAKHKFLTFYLDDEEYGIEIRKVQEIIGWLPITPVPRAPRFTKGVINLRGQIIPVADLRLRLGMAPKEPTAETCIVVVEAGGVKKGIVVDRMSEVSDIPVNSIEEPTNDTGVQPRYIIGIGKLDNRIRILLDVDQVLDMTENMVEGALSGASGSQDKGD